jgi:hypothetical protein
MNVKNCWDVIDCGRGPGGRLVDTHGVCQVAVDMTYHGINRGTNAGRYCWRVDGTACHGEPQGSFSKKAEECGKCEFFHMVCEEEAEALVL